MADSERGPNLRASRFQRHQGHALFSSAQGCGGKAGHIAQAFDMHTNGAHSGVVDQVVDEIFKA